MVLKEEILIRRKQGIKHGRLISSLRLNLQLNAYEGQIPKGAKILDFGCGNGAFGAALARHFQAEVIGTDIEDFLCYDLPFFLNKNRSLNDIFKKNSFDAIIMNDMIHHIPKNKQLSYIQEALGVGKKVLIVDTYPTYIAKFLDILMGYIVYHGKETISLSHRTPQEWETLIKPLGLPYNIKDVESPFYYPLRHFIISIANDDKI